jgi:hypothetical protein
LSALLLIGVLSEVALSGAEIQVDFSRTDGVIRPLHGGNNGPLCSGEILDLTAFHRELRLPFTRLHDSAWPYPDIVDIHAIFPDFSADPAVPASYRFGPTDDYLRAITNTGAGIVYRLGESIEHARRKRYVHPPPDPEKWAAICAGLIRHCNEGWADGHHFGIRYWEIWNEPENRPTMWTGTPAQFYRLYATAAKALKTRWPDLKIGGPALGHQGEFREGALRPSEFLRGFVEHIRREQAPLDFFSWHLYTTNAMRVRERARAVRAFLDQEGFPSAESHLNEWNYLPDHDWGPVLGSPGARRERWYARQGGAEGAAFLAAALLALQDAPLDVANYYSADNQAFGLFTLHGAPKKTFYAMKAFRALLECPRRVEVNSPAEAFVFAGLATGNDRAALLLSQPGFVERTWTVELRGLPWPGPTIVEVSRLDETHDLERVQTKRLSTAPAILTLEGRPPAVTLVELRPAVR